MKTIKALVDLSNKLDASGLSSYADQVDKTTQSITKIVKAQFEGGYGYAIRNTRCWEKCYRENRVKSPDKSAQEVVFSCWDEYQKSIGDNNSGWEKYADEETPIIKTAQTKALSSKVVNLVKSGSTVTEALSLVEGEERDKALIAMIEKSEELLKIASSLKKMDKKSSDELVVLAQELIKEAGFWGGIAGKGEVYKQGIEKFKQNVQPLQQMLQQISQNPEQSRKVVVRAVQNMDVTMKNLEEFQKTSGFASRSLRGFISQVRSSLMPFRQGLADAYNSKNTQALKQHASSAFQTLSGLIQQAGVVELQAVKEDPKAGQQGGQPQQGDKSADIMDIVKSADQNKMKEIVGWIMSDATLRDAAKQWYSSIPTLKPVASNSYNLKTSQSFDRSQPTQPVQGGATKPDSKPAITPDMVKQIMTSISTKMGPAFKPWFEQAYGANLGQSSTQPETQSEEIGLEQVVGFLNGLLTKMQTMSKGFPEQKQKQVSKYINYVNKTMVPNIKKIENFVKSMTEVKVMPQQSIYSEKKEDFLKKQ